MQYSSQPHIFDQREKYYTVDENILHQCPICGGGYSYKLIGPHICEHEFCSPFICMICRQRDNTLSKVVIANHLLGHLHIELKCNICGQINTDKDTFLKHISEEHNISFYTCPYCKFECRNHEHARQHLQSHIVHSLAASKDQLDNRLTFSVNRECNISNDKHQRTKEMIDQQAGLPVADSRGRYVLYPVNDKDPSVKETFSSIQHRASSSIQYGASSSIQYGASSSIQYGGTVPKRNEMHQQMVMQVEEGLQIRLRDQFITDEAEEGTNEISDMGENNGTVSIQDQNVEQESIESPVTQEAMEYSSIFWMYEKNFVFDKGIIQSCIICGFESHHMDLREHLNNHQYSQYTCSKCNHSSKKKSDLINHLLLHNESKPFKCLKCGKDFKLRCVIIRHLRNKHGINFCCPCCKKQSRNYNELLKHFTKECKCKKRSDISGGQCERIIEFMHYETNTEDNTQSHPRPVTDQETVQTLTSNGEINNGQIEISNVQTLLNKNISSEGNFSCLHCDLTFPDKDVLSEHWALHDDEILVLEDDNVDNSDDIMVLEDDHVDNSTCSQNIPNEETLVDDNNQANHGDDVYERGLFANLKEFASSLPLSKKQGSKRSPADSAECNDLSKSNQLTLHECKRSSPDSAECNDLLKSKQLMLHEPHMVQYSWILDGNDKQYSLALKQEEYFVGQWMRSQLL